MPTWGPSLAPGGILLYLSTIQLMKQQQSLLEFMENSSLTLIAFHHENPYFYVEPCVMTQCFDSKAVSREESGTRCPAGTEDRAGPFASAPGLGAGCAPADRHRLQRRRPQDHQCGGTSVPGVMPRDEGVLTLGDNGAGGPAAATYGTTEAATPCTTPPPP